MKILILGGTGAMGTELVSLAGTLENELYVTSRSQRESEKSNIHYVCGNALDNDFIQNLLTKEFYDAIVDFMSYSTDLFESRIDLLLNHTNQYVFLSSARVYSNYCPLNEKSPRLLDDCKDKDYLETDEYAIAKARQENVLLKSNKHNWIIIRPYITYSKNRLQLGLLEKEQWLYRALNNKTIVVSSDILEKETTMTFGGDVAHCINLLIGRKAACGEIYQITCDNHLKWRDILNLYCEELSKNRGRRPLVLEEKSYHSLGKVIGREYQAKYDRLYNRIFDNTKIKSISVDNFIVPEEGLRECLRDFINMEVVINKPDWRYEGYADKIAGEITPIISVAGIKNKIRYFLARYTCYYEKR